MKSLRVLWVKIRSWLQRQGFSYKKPAVVPGKANKEQQEAWLAEYEKLKQGLSKHETICFTDNDYENG